jgi:hypothetical protein
VKTPSKVSLNEFVAAFRDYFHKNVVGSHCTMCGRQVDFVPAYISKHDSRFDTPTQFRCSGNGKVEIVAIPFCRNCETQPDEYGCVHLEEISLAERAYAGIMKMPKPGK